MQPLVASLAPPRRRLHETHTTLTKLPASPHSHEAQDGGGSVCESGMPRWSSPSSMAVRMEEKVEPGSGVATPPARLHRRCASSPEQPPLQGTGPGLKDRPWTALLRGDAAPAARAAPAVAEGPPLHSALLGRRQSRAPQRLTYFQINVPAALATLRPPRGRDGEGTLADVEHARPPSKSQVCCCSPRASRWARRRRPRAYALASASSSRTTARCMAN